MIYPSYSHSDIDECSSANECHLDTTCTNTNGSYNCTCKDGFKGDGKNCTGNILLKSITTKRFHKKNFQKGEFFCHDFPNFHGPGHQNASLISLSLALFILSPDIDECYLENVCHLDATCNNTKGSYNCTCKDGFEGDGRNNCTGKIEFHFKSIIMHKELAE